MRRSILLLAVTLIAASQAGAARAEFDLVYQIEDIGGSFTPDEIEILSEALGRAERAWETVITGYTTLLPIQSVLIHVWPTDFGLASATYNSLFTHESLTFVLGGDMYVNVNEIENFANWQGPGANGLNFVDELLAHETGHVLGIGTLWTLNGVYVPESFQYTGAYGLAAYRDEFDSTANWVPVEDAGDSGTAGAHWNQRMRSSAQEGNPPDPWILDPRVGIFDSLGRDLGLEILTGAIDPDYLEPFLSRTTVESMRDMGYTTTRFEDANGDGLVDHGDLAIWAANFGSTGLQIDSFAFGDADRDRTVAGRDFLLWQRAFGESGDVASVPEPAAGALVALGVVTLLRRRR